MPHRDLGDTFVPAVDAAVPTGHDTLQDRQDSTCVQSVEHPVWYGADFDTCSMTTTTAPCSVVFPSTSCHTVGPGRFLMADGMLESIKLWTVIGMTVFLTMLIPVSILWMRWKLSSPRRGGKRSISIQLEKNEDKGSSKQQATSESSSTPETASGNRRDLLGPNSRLDALNRLLGRDRGTRAGESGNIEVVNNVNTNGAQTGHHTNRRQPAAVPPPRAPRIETESLPLNHPARWPQYQPWMHQDRDGRWVPREEGYLQPGLPPSRGLRHDRRNLREENQAGNRGRGRYDVPGGRR